MKSTFEAYVAPVNESALLKGIPMSERDSEWVQDFVSRVNGYVRYRGPRRPGTVGQQTCLKEDATSFAIYRRS